jgi:hypothetical protein
MICVMDTPEIEQLGSTAEVRSTVPDTTATIEI